MKRATLLTQLDKIATHVQWDSEKVEKWMLCLEELRMRKTEALDSELKAQELSDMERCTSASMC